MLEASVHLCHMQFHQGRACFAFLTHYKQDREEQRMKSLFRINMRLMRQAGGRAGAHYFRSPEVRAPSATISHPARAREMEADSTMLLTSRLSALTPASALHSLSAQAPPSHAIHLSLWRFFLSSPLTFDMPTSPCSCESFRCRRPLRAFRRRRFC
jgi:hypothetical protein